MEEALAGGTQEQLSAAIALPGNATVAPQAVADLAKMSLKIDERTFQTVDARSASVSATVDGTAWTVFLLKVEDVWKITDAVEVAP